MATEQISPPSDLRDLYTALTNRENGFLMEQIHESLQPQVKELVVTIRTTIEEILSDSDSPSGKYYKNILIKKDGTEDYRFDTDATLPDAGLSLEADQSKSEQLYQKHQTAKELTDAILATRMDINNIKVLIRLQKIFTKSGLAVVRHGETPTNKGKDGIK